MPPRAILLAVVAAALVWVRVPRAGSETPFTLDAAGERWVSQTSSRLTLDEKIGQLIVPAIESSVLGADAGANAGANTDTFERLAVLVRRLHVGGFLVLGETAPALGRVDAVASLLNRLQAVSDVPLMNAADFEAGVGSRLSGGTTFPRAMAIGAAADERLAFEAARITAVEARAIGVHVLFAPVADVNSNPRNPVINTRSFGEDPSRVAMFARAQVNGARAGGALATAKHFPGHGDADTDSHLALPLISGARERLDRVELVPFRAAIDAGVPAVMAGHLVVPALDPSKRPATLSARILGDVLRTELGFRGLIYSDSMSMDAVAKMLSPGEAAVAAVEAGVDQVVYSPDPAAAVAALKAAAVSGRLTEALLNASVERVLRAKASLGLHATRLVDLPAVPAAVGVRASQDVAREMAERSITLLRDAHHQVPLAAARDTPVLYLSVVDYQGGWLGAPGRTFVPELKKRWPNVAVVEVSDRTPPAELDGVRAMAARHVVVLASVFVRTASGSGRMDLAAPLVGLLRDVAGDTERRGVPLITTFFGNPYTASFLPELPAVLLTYDFYDLPEAAAVRAIAGESPITGRLPVTLPDLRK